jgi:hypothetical protein
LPHCSGVLSPCWPPPPKAAVDSGSAIFDTGEFMSPHDLTDYIPGFPNTPIQEIFADSVLLGELRFVSLSWLRKLKAVANRHKDLDDLEHLPPA